MQIQISSANHLKHAPAHERGSVNVSTRSYGW